MEENNQTQQTNDQKTWVSIHGNAMSITDRAAADYGKNITFRYPIPVPFDGDAVKLTFDNFCGTEPVTITYARIAVAVGAEQVQPNENYLITFHGVPSVTIPAGKKAECDPSPLHARKGSLLSVSFYFADYVQLRSGVTITGPLSKGNYTFGNFVDSEQLPQEHTRNTKIRYFLSDVSLLTEPQNKAVICYGDSITAQSWPDYLAMEFPACGEQNRSVVRKAASGTRILRQYSCATYESYGLCGKIRFPHEIPSVNGADSVIIQQGINDIIHPVGVVENPFRPWSDLPKTAELIEGLKKYIHQARKYGLKVYMGTLLPFEGWRTYADFRENMKEEVNAFIRSTDLIDGVIDFDKVVRDPLHPTRFQKEFNSGDNLHPSELAYREMAKEAARVLQTK
ncbi:MAG: lipase [Clostridia bacterium]|nr:lipase [Clostridia bacterium]